MTKAKTKEEPVAKTEEVGESQGLGDPTEEKVDKEKGDGKVVQHPQFQKRIDQFTSRLSETQARLDAVNTERQQEKAAFDQLAEQYKQLASTLDNVQDKVDTTNMPDPNEDPVGYANAREEKFLRKVEKMMSQNVQATPSAQQPQYSQPTDNVVLTPEQRVQEIALATINPDYYDIINEVNQDMARDSVLRNQVMSSTNPAKEAYEYGKEKRSRAMQTKDRQFDQAFTESGSTPPTTEREQPLTAADKIILRKLNMTPEQYVEHRKKMKKEGRII